MIRVLAVPLVIAPLVFAVPPQHKPASASTTAHKKSSGKSHLTAVRKSRSRRGRHVAAAPSYQLHPDAERYRQIQQALADRGYFKGTADGTWGDDSLDALKRFQADQKLDPDGKINALSLTGLGLGPKHDGTTAATVPLSATKDSPLDPPLDLPATPLPFELPENLPAPPPQE